MTEEWKVRGKLLQELDALRNRVAQLERSEGGNADGESEGPEQAFRAIFADVAEGILLADVEKKKFITGNKAICRMLRVDPEQITSLKVTDIYPQEDADYIKEQFERQANGDLTLAKDVPVRRKDGGIFYADINSVPVTLAGRTYLMSVFRKAHRRKVQPPKQNDGNNSYPGKPLTASEMRVLRLIVQGMSNREIARSVHRSVRTVEGHRAHLMRKLCVENSVELVKRAAAMGLVDLPAGHRAEVERTSPA